MALTEAQVVILYFFRIDVVSSIMRITEKSNTIWRELRVQFPIVLVEQKKKHSLHKGVKFINISFPDIAIFEILAFSSHFKYMSMYQTQLLYTSAIGSITLTTL